MAFNAYLVIQTNQSVKIKGESTSEIATGKGAIEVTDFGFGVSMPVTAARSDGGGATVGRANFDVFTASKNIDTATVDLVRYCCKGTAIPKIFLHLYRQGDENSSGVVKYALIVFEHCVITKVGISGGGEELPKESLEFNYGTCEYYYQLTSHDSGKAIGAPVKAGWSTIKNAVHVSGVDFNAFDSAG